jgi:hypothetical protein
LFSSERIEPGSETEIASSREFNRGMNTDPSVATALVTSSNTEHVIFDELVAVTPSAARPSDL